MIKSSASAELFLQEVIFTVRIMALDVGDKRIGVALSDPLKITVQGLTTYQRTILKEDVEGIWQLIREHEVEELVVGLPKNMDGSQGYKVDDVKFFVDQLLKKGDIPIHWVDERLTTVSAERTLLEADVSRKKRKTVIDKMAATIILQSYLERL